MLCAIGAVASASVAANAADLQLHLTELVAALIRPALTCSRSAPQHCERCWLLPVCCVRLAQWHLLSSKRCSQMQRSGSSFDAGRSGIASTDSDVS